MASQEQILQKIMESALTSTEKERLMALAAFGTSKLQNQVLLVLEKFEQARKKNIQLKKQRTGEFKSFLQKTVEKAVHIAEQKQLLSLEQQIEILS